MPGRDALPLDRDTQNALRTFGTLGHLGFVLGGSALFGWWVGAWLDRKLGTDPWLMVSAMFLFLAAGGYECWRMLKPLLTEDCKHDDRPPGG